jgi:DNA-binding NarL/FixJ family response regulator
VHLSSREREVLQLVSAGLTNQDIAREICISVNTVSNHMTSILSKLGAANRTEAVSIGRRMHVIP